MNNIWNKIQVAFASLGGVIGWFLGGGDGFLYALIAFIAVDYVSGVLCAIFDKNLSSTIGFKGITKKILIFALVGIGNILDIIIIKEGSAVRTAVIFFYLSNEGISILENAAHLDLPLPQVLKNVLKSLGKEDEDES